MRFKLLRWFVPVCVIFFTSPLFVHASDSLLPQKEVKSQVTSPVQAKLITENTAIHPGEPFWVGIELKMDKGWDTYWLNPGDSGFPTKVEWHLPQGFTAGKLQWPYPQKFTSQALVGYGYTDDVLLLSQITPPKTLDASSVTTLSADVSWLACKEQCVPGNAHLELPLKINATAAEKDPVIAQQFEKAKLKLPKTLEGSVTAGVTQGKEMMLKFSGNFKEIVDALFIPETNELIDHSVPQQLVKGQNLYTLNIKMMDQASPEHVKGVLLVSEKGSAEKQAIQIDTSVMKAVSGHHAALTMPIALICAFIGGLILNVMPCVLPVIALKIFSFVKMSGEKKSTLLKHGGIFAFGVLLSFWILSGILLVLRAYGATLGWGFQLQEPLFVIALTIVLFLLALSLFGVFEFGTSLIALGEKGQSSQTPFKSSFLSGVLATLVATPCTGPLLGPALGFAMTLPFTFSLMIFTAMGLGMASPYLLFSAFPQLIRFLPKPGNWMIVFKQLMGFLMMATCLWLVWVLSAQTTMLSVFVLLAALLVMAVGGWIYGRWSTPLKSKMIRRVACSIALGLCVLSGGGAMMVAKGQKQVEIAATAPQSGWQAYSPQKVEELRKNGTPVFVDFTAKWCLICQANKVILHSGDIQKAFASKGVVTMEADWTKRDPVITSELQKMGRSGVPVYVLYSPNLSDPPKILPQTLTKSIVSNYLSQLK